MFKKSLLSLIALLALAAPSFAVDLPKKVLYQGSFVQTADGLVTFNVNGRNSSWLPLGGLNPTRVVADLDVSAVTGTSPTLDVRFKTRVKNSGTSPAVSTMNLANAAGTAFAMTQATAATREIKALAVMDSDTGSSNLGQELAVFNDVGGTSPSFTGTITVYVAE